MFTCVSICFGHQLKSIDHDYRHKLNNSHTRVHMTGNISIFTHEDWHRFISETLNTGLFLQQIADSAPLLACLSAILSISLRSSTYVHATPLVPQSRIRFSLSRSPQFTQYSMADIIYYLLKRQLWVFLSGRFWFQACSNLETALWCMHILRIADLATVVQVTIDRTEIFG